MATSKAMAPSAKKFGAASNTRAINAASKVTGYFGGYSPSANSARATHLSWQALRQVAAANPNGFTVQQYLEQQAKTNPANVGDALPCLRYWANNGNVQIV
jgi:hypothetical protein